VTSFNVLTYLKRMDKAIMSLALNCMEKNGHKILFFGGPIRHKILITKNKRKKKKREWTEIARTE
jgi:hypothetical protein